MGKEERGGAAQSGFLLLGLFTLRYIPLKHKLGWLVKPVLFVIDYQLLDCFFLRKEIRPCRKKPDYRYFILRVAQGVRTNSLKRFSSRNRSFFCLSLIKFKKLKKTLKNGLDEFSSKTACVTPQNW